MALGRPCPVQGHGERKKSTKSSCSPSPLPTCWLPQWDPCPFCLACQSSNRQWRGGVKKKKPRAGEPMGFSDSFFLLFFYCSSGGPRSLWVVVLERFHPFFASLGSLRANQCQPPPLIGVKIQAPMPAPLLLGDRPSLFPCSPTPPVALQVCFPPMTTTRKHPCRTHLLSCLGKASCLRRLAEPLTVTLQKTNGFVLLLLSFGFPLSIPPLTSSGSSFPFCQSSPTLDPGGKDSLASS